MAAVADHTPAEVFRGMVLARAGTLEVSLATGPAEIEQAQRLRHRVFSGEFGAPLGSHGIDHDIFDPFCLHLVVRDLRTEGVVATYRVLLPEQARLLGCLYTEREFWLTRLQPIRPRIVELGRSCVHPDYRGSAAILLLWSGLGEMLSRTDHRFLIGCASVSLDDGGALAAGLFHRLRTDHYAPEEYRVWPRDRLPIEQIAAVADPVAPPLLKAYLRTGARLLGEPHRDREFGCADFPLLLDLALLAGRYRRRFAPGLAVGTTDRHTRLAAAVA